MIKTTVGRAMELFVALEEIRGQKMKKESAKKVFDMRNKVKSVFEFYNEQQKEVIERMGLSVSDDGKINFKNDISKVRAYQDEMEELRNVEQDIDIEKIDLSNEEIEVSEAFLETADGFIIL